MLEKKQLPLDVLRLIFSHLTPLEILTLSQTSKQLRKMSEDNWVWFHKLKIHFPHVLYTIRGKIEHTDCKALFNQHYCSEYEKLTPNQRHIFTLVKEGQVDKLKEQPITTESLFTILDSNDHNVFFWASKQQKILDYFYDIIVNEVRQTSQAHSQDPLHPDKFGYGLLHYMIMCNQIDQVKILQTSGINILEKSQSTMEYSGLHLAAQHGHTQMVLLLIKHDPTKINVCDKFQQTALIWACAYGHTCTVTTLLENGANTEKYTHAPKSDDHGKNAMYWATENSHDKIVTLLLNHNVSIITTDTVSDIQPIHIASYNGNLAIVKKLVEHDPSCVNTKNKSGETALIYAAKMGHLTVVEYLLDNKANIECFTNAGCFYKCGKTALYLATKGGHTNVVSHLLKYGANAKVKCGYYPKQPIHVAASKGNCNMLRLLINHDPSLIHEKDAFNWEATVTDTAYSNNKTEAVGLLLSLGASAYIRLWDGTYEHYIHYSIKNYDPHMVKAIIRHNPHLIDCYNTAHQTPLEIAIIENKPHIADFLIDNGANISDKLYGSPLGVDSKLTAKQYAFERNRIDIAMSIAAREHLLKNRNKTLTDQYEIDRRMCQIEKIHNILSELKSKTYDLHRRKSHKAEKCAKSLISHIRDDAITYLSNPAPDALIEFQSKCLNRIKAATPELAKHRGWKRLLGNLMIAVLTLGTAFLINKAITGNFLFFHKTRSSELLENATTVLDELTPKRCIHGVLIK